MRNDSSASRRSVHVIRKQQDEDSDASMSSAVTVRTRTSNYKQRKPFSSTTLLPSWLRLCSIALMAMLVSSGWLYTIIQEDNKESFAFLRLAGPNSSWRLQVLRTVALPQVDWVPYPRVIQVVANQDDEVRYEIISEENPGHPKKSSRRLGDDPDRNILYSNGPHRYSRPDRIGGDDEDNEDCHPAGDWQIDHHPTCTNIHELDLTDDPFFVAAGGYRRVFKVQDMDADRTPRVLKTLNVPMEEKESGDFDLRNADRHRRDALAFEQLTDSPYVVDLFAYCSNSAVFNFGSGGDLGRLFKNNPSITEPEVMSIAYNITMAMHDAHHFHPENGLATMAHTDIKPDQFLLEGGYYKLTDFNRVRFLGHKETESGPKVCTFTVGKNAGLWRAPEEYAYEPETNAVDVYSLGNVLHFLLTREKAWYHDMDKYELTEETVYKFVINGTFPMLPSKIRHIVRDDPDNLFVKYMMRARDACLIRDQHKRPTALQIAAILKEGVDALHG